MMGMSDNYRYAFPLLLNADLPATWFVTVGLLEQDPGVIRSFQYFRKMGADELAPLAWSQVREMIDAGMTFGAHTYSHPNLLHLAQPQLEVEITRAKHDMEDRIGQPVDGFAYPFGRPRCHFNDRTVEIVQDAGYQYAVAAFFRGVVPRRLSLDVASSQLARR